MHRGLAGRLLSGGRCCCNNNSGASAATSASLHRRVLDAAALAPAPRLFSASRRLGSAAAAEAAGGSGGGGAGDSNNSATPKQQQQQQQHSPPPPLMARFEADDVEVLHDRYLTLYSRRVRFYPAAAAAAEGSAASSVDASAAAAGASAAAEGDGGGNGAAAATATASASAQAQPPQPKELVFDVIGHPQSDFKFAVTFPFHPHRDGRKGGEVTLLKEYAQGLNALVHCLPTGGFDPRKHACLEACARAELSEEALLAGGRWVPLLPPGHPGLTETKWCRNRFQPFLVIDPVPDSTPGRRDAEEVTIEVRRVGLDEFKRLMSGADAEGGDMLLPSVVTGFLALERLKEEGLL